VQPSQKEWCDQCRSLQKGGDVLATRTAELEVVILPKAIALIKNQELESSLKFRTGVRAMAI